MGGFTGAIRLAGGSAIVLLVMAGLLVPAEVWATPFPSGPATDGPFASDTDFWVTITPAPTAPITYTYSTTFITDPDTQVGRSAIITEGSPSDDPNGTLIITGLCTACSPVVKDSDFTCWPVIPPNWENDPGKREIHTEILSLDLCGTAVSNEPGNLTPYVCYLAGQPAYDALDGVGAASLYENSFGEVEPDLPTTNPNYDFPATSFFNVNGVVTITPAPAGTSGVFVLADAGDTILMVNRDVKELPPPGSYFWEPGTTVPGTAGPTDCSEFPIALIDATDPATIGEILNPPHHVVEDAPLPPPHGHGISVDSPTLSRWGLILVAVMLLTAGVLVIRRRGARGQVPPGS